MTLAYDKRTINNQLCLDLPFREATGILAHDRARADRQIDFVNTPTWATIASGLGVLDFDEPSHEYLECDTLDTTDLDFTTGDYSIAVWLNWCDTTSSEIIVARYELDVDGWETYFYDSILQLRHHHAGGATDRTGAYSYGWTPLIWWLMGITRSGAYPLHYRNGVELEMGYSTGGMLDPATCNQDLVIGVRYSKDNDWYDGQMQGLRIWDRELSSSEMMMLFQRERHWFGV